MLKTIRLDDNTVIKLSKIDAIHQYNIWNIKVYGAGGVFKIKISHDHDNAGKITNLFIKSLEVLIDPKKNPDKYQTVKNHWTRYNGTFKQFIIDNVNNSIL